MSLPGVSETIKKDDLYLEPQKMKSSWERISAVARGFLMLGIAAGLGYGCYSSFSHLHFGMNVGPCLGYLWGGIGAGAGAVIALKRGLELFEAAYKKNRTLNEIDYFSTLFGNKTYILNLIQKRGVHLEETFWGARKFEKRDFDFTGKAFCKYPLLEKIPVAFHGRGKNAFFAK